MIKEEILAFINQNPVFFLATQEGRQPRVRGMMIVEADENGLLFSTSKQKDVYRQLSEHPQVELCFFNAAETKQVRVTGTVEITEDLEVKKKVVSRFPFLKPMVDQEGWDILAAYYLRRGLAHVWTMEANLESKRYVEL